MAGSHYILTCYFVFLQTAALSKEKSDIINNNEEREDSRAEQSSRTGSSLELKTSEELYRSANTIQSDSSDSETDYSSLELEISEELYRTAKTIESASSDSKTDYSSLELETSEEIYRTCKTIQSDSSDSKTDYSSLELETSEKLYKIAKTIQSDSSDSKTDYSSLELETSEEIYRIAKTTQSDSSDSKSDYYSLELETSEELHTSIKPSQSESSHDETHTTRDMCLEEPHQSDEERSGTVPLSLESFTFHQTLGVGAFGKVFLARDLIRKECVAIKASAKRNLTWTRSNYIECHVLKLSHESPYLIHGLAAFHTLSCVYFVMELANGGHLDHFIFNNFPLDTTTIKFITAEVICGTEFLHKKGIIHRDLKPENILLTADGHVKITDFGIAIVVSAYKKTKFRCRGTPGYAAPEMVMDKEHGRGVDYFAIGAILYKLCTSTRPFPGYRISDIQHAVIHHTPRYPRSLNRVTQNILKGLLCKNQFKRLGVKGDIRKHPFFDGTNWEDVEARRVAPPAIMIADSVDLNINRTLDYAERPNRRITVDPKIFKRFSFVCPEWSRHYHPAIMKITA
ncbi:cAMP-dependent protein kinase, catalytic subunit-like [Eleutherodactylus coqui]|uniref:cAMP-dependent protein kinase, catalytic subunit-like n=1 Tax=Eleutherodactylus coqui TaxID=57060 RepID=UPI003462630B